MDSFTEKMPQHYECSCRTNEGTSGRDEKPLHAICKTTEGSEYGVTNEWRDGYNACNAR